jgi:F-type H+-transporting ATPase subunit delta
MCRVKSVNVAVAGRYARALAELIGAGDPAALQRAAAELDLLADVFRLDPKLTTFFEDPSVRLAHKRQAGEALAAKARLSETGRRFLGTLVENGRVGAIPAIAAEFTEIADAMIGVVPAEATVAVRLTEAEVASFTRALETMTGRRVRLSVKVDPAVIGGARTRVGSRVFDGTLRGRLDALRRRLAAAR